MDVYRRQDLKVGHSQTQLVNTSFHDDLRSSAAELPPVRSVEGSQLLSVPGLETNTVE